MRFADLIRSSLASLWQRKFRTSLTVVGVVIGTMAVVVMVSLGVGLSKAQLDSIEQYSSLRQITIYSTSMMEGDPAAEVVPMDDNLVAELAALPGVADVWPAYFADAEVNLQGNVMWMQFMGVPHAMLESLDVEFATGGIPDQGAPLALVAGDKVGEMYFWDPVTGMPLEVDMATQQFFVTFPGSEGPMEPQPGSDGEEPAAAAPPQKFLVPVAGVIAGEEMEWGQHSTALYADLAALVRTLEEAFPGKALPGQPATPGGKPMGAFVYSQLVMMADDIPAAKELTTMLRDQGYQIDAAVEWMDQMEQQSALIQAVFGGIGAISLLVAAIGIANTMLMSVYERTREIGIMKVLGAALRDIRNMFLLESACIGFFGGLFGLLLSLAVSTVVNATLGGAMGMGMGTTEISVVPAWLALGAVAFSTLIGTVAGLVPAQRAMRLSALGAIRAQ
ncbi:ABC transporter permease [Tessaracoccus terricola]